MTMNNCSYGCIRLVDCCVRQRFGRGYRSAFISDLVLPKIARHYFCAVRQGQFVYASGRRTGDVELVSRAVPYAQVTEPNTILIHTDQMEIEKFPSIYI